MNTKTPAKMIQTTDASDPTEIAIDPVPVLWRYKGETYRSSVVAVCSECGVAAVVRLPPAILAEQTDGTTHVCLPTAGGCNHGFGSSPA